MTICKTNTPVEEKWTPSLMSGVTTQHNFAALNLSLVRSCKEPFAQLAGRVFNASQTPERNSLCATHCLGQTDLSQGLVCYCVIMYFCSPTT